MKELIIAIVSLIGHLIVYPVGAQTDSYPTGIKYVVVIGVDGLSPDGLMNASTPTIDRMIVEGASTLNARAVLPTSSSTNWMSMISGSGPEQHGVTSNGWERNDHELPPVVEGDEGIFPTIFSTIKKARPNSRIAAIYDWSGFGRLIEKTFIDFDDDAGDEYQTTRSAVDHIIKEKPDFTFIHLDHVDHAGHAHGHKTSEYYHSVTIADSLAGEILAAVQKAGMADSTLVILSSDHGGIGYGHGGESLDEIEIPFVLLGPNIKKGYKIPHTVFTYDNAATVAFALGVQQPYAWIGRPVKSAFKGWQEPKGISKSTAYLSLPTLIPRARLYEPAGGLFLDKDALATITHPREDVDIRFTLDGSDPNISSPKYSEPIELSKSTVVSARAYMGNQTSKIARAHYRILKTNSNDLHGIKYRYYEGSGWDFLPIFQKLHAKKTGKTYQFRIDSINQVDAQFAIAYESYLQIDTPGSYAFYLTSDDGSKLIINDETVIDNDGSHGAKTRKGSVDLPKGKSKIEVQYFNNGGGSWLELQYAGPTVVKQIVPPEKLFVEQ